MANMRTIRSQIKGVQNIAKITRAMEMIATSRMRRAQDTGLAGRPYSERICQVVSELYGLPEAVENLHPLLVTRPVERLTVVHITPDRGLCGGLNSNLNRSAANFILGQKDIQVNLICVGRKGVEFMHRTGQNLTAEFIKIGDRPTMMDTLPISRMIMEEYTNAATDAVYLSYAEFVSTTIQRPIVRQVLPVQPACAAPGESNEYIFEPGPEMVLGALLPRFIESEIYHAILESIASEQSAKVVAMRNATENAGELIESLTLAYNKARQESITTELLEIVGGAAAV